MSICSCSGPFRHILEHEKLVSLCLGGRRFKKQEVTVSLALAKDVRSKSLFSGFDSALWTFQLSSCLRCIVTMWLMVNRRNQDVALLPFKKPRGRTLTISLCNVTCLIVLFLSSKHISLLDEKKNTISTNCFARWPRLVVPPGREGRGTGRG